MARAVHIIFPQHANSVCQHTIIISGLLAVPLAHYRNLLYNLARNSDPYSHEYGKHSANASTSHGKNGRLPAPRYSFCTKQMYLFCFGATYRKARKGCSKAMRHVALKLLRSRRGGAGFAQYFCKHAASGLLQSSLCGSSGKNEPAVSRCFARARCSDVRGLGRRGGRAF